MNSPPRQPLPPALTLSASRRLPSPPPAAHPSPPVDPHTAAWILEFVLRQPIHDWLANEIFLALPIAGPLSPRIQKTILLRRIASELSRRSVSDRTLHSLELIEELDRLTGGAAPSDPMRTAYCSVAVDCTVRSLRDPDGDFPYTVEMIWDRRLADLERSEAAGLASGRLKEWRKVMQRALVDLDVRKELSRRETRDEALDAVRDYLNEANGAMGPPFLELAAEAFHREGMGAIGANRLPEELDGKGKNPEAGRGGERSPSSTRAHEEQGLDGSHFMELDRERQSRTSGNDKHNGGTKAAGQGASKKNGCSTNKFDCLRTPEVSKVMEALKTSREDLQMAVEDPLPDAINTASGVLTRRSGEAKDLEDQQENLCQVDGNASVCAAEMGPRVSCVEGSGANTMQNRDRGAKELEGNQDRVVSNAPLPFFGTDAEVSRKDSTSTCIERNKDKLVPQPSLMDRNPTAHTYEWDEDSIDSPSENSQSPSKKFRLPSPKRRAVSPLKLMENKRFLRRRKIKKWSLLEEDTLREAVKKHGVGNWKFILSCYTGLFEDRTEVDLKDKWRNMIRH